MRIVKASEIQPSTKEIKQIWKSIKNANVRCRVPTIPGEPPESHKMTNCHIISEPCLEVIARDSHIYEWARDPTVLWNSAVNEIKLGNITSLPGDVVKATPFDDRGNSIGKCVWRFACNYHDNKVFKPIDTPDMDLNSLGVQFLLGLRTIVATTAWAESYLQFCSKKFLKRSRTKKILREYPQAQSTVPPFKQRVNRLQKGVDRLTKDLGQWQEMYRAQAVMGYPIITCRRTAKPAIRSAGAGVPAWSGQSAIIAIILPKRQDGQAKTLCDIVVTCVKPNFWLMRLYRRWRINRVARRIETLLRKNPVTNIPILVETLQFFYVSPNDFDNDSIMDDEQRQEIHARIASERDPVQS